MIKIGITGSLASGKTTASKILSYRRGPLFSADKAVKELYKNNHFKSLIGRRFKIKNNNQLKKSLKNLILKNKDNIKKLEKIIHPLVRKKMKSFTSQKVNNLLRKIVEEGTGKNAKVNGLMVGGKTGTSRKLENGEYSEKKVITSFIGTFPINKPKYIAFVLFDEPRRNTREFLENFGGNTAAPTFSRIVRKISPILNKNNYLKNF